MNARVTVLHDVTAVSAEATAGLSGDDSLPAPVTFEAAIQLLEQPFMEFTAVERAETGAALRIETVDAVWLGEVEQCSADGGGFCTRVRLRHVLRDFETLTRLAERFGMPAPKGLTVQV